jgi:hypothetical protein
MDLIQIRVYIYALFCVELSHEGIGPKIITGVIASITENRWFKTSPISKVIVEYL